MASMIGKHDASFLSSSLCLSIFIFPLPFTDLIDTSNGSADAEQGVRLG